MMVYTSKITGVKKTNDLLFLVVLWLTGSSVGCSVDCSLAMAGRSR